MRELIFTHEGSLEKGKIVERINRFTLTVEFDSGLEKVYLGNPGALSTVIAPESVILCEPVSGENRKTDYNAFAIKVDDFYVTVHSTFANSIFFEVFEKGFLSDFRPYDLVSREPALPDHGRADFLLENEETGGQAYVEIKSCTHVEGGVAKFPDRPTERGKRHLRSLGDLVEKDYESYVFFVVQRPDAEEFQPFREVDPEFADLLGMAEESGVNIRAISTEFDPPNLYLKNDNLPVSLI